MKIFIVCLLFAATYAKPPQGFFNPLFQSMIDEVNVKQTTWKAGHNFDKNIDYKHLERLCGTFLEDPRRKLMPGIVKIFVYAERRTSLLKNI